MDLTIHGADDDASARACLRLDACCGLMRSAAARRTNPPTRPRCEQCLISGQPAERSATFAGEMTMIPGAARMSMRIELLERTPGETGYRPVLAPGLGVWRTADPGVQLLPAPRTGHQPRRAGLLPRARSRFRWSGPHGRVVRRDELRTPRCAQPAPATPTPAAAASPLE